MGDAHVTTLADGRELCWTEFGDPSGWPVFGFHGTPGSRSQVCIYESHPRDAGVRLVVPDRPGYGLSSFHPGRRLVDWPADVAELADHLGIQRFSVMGISGGGPHVAACAALLPDRVAVAGIVSGAGPLGDPLLAGELARGDQVIVALARRFPYLLHLSSSAQVSVARRFPRQTFDLFCRQLPAPDAAVLRRPEVRALFEDDMARAPRTMGAAWGQDLQLFASEWGFEFSAISVPVVLWHGTEDRAVPAAHVRLMHEEIEGSVLHTVEGEGHLFVIDGLEAILRELVPS